jgi:hypothetical protein
MATRRETNVVYVAGLVQGVVLVTFPAASTIFTDPDQYDLSRTRLRGEVPFSGRHGHRRQPAVMGGLSFVIGRPPALHHRPV